MFTIDAIPNRDPRNDQANSFTLLKTLVFKHSVDMSPRSILVFGPNDVELIMDYMLRRFARTAYML